MDMGPFTPDVSAVVLRARTGDREAFRPLVERYQNAVSAAALAIVRDVSWSHDIAQEVFVEAWSNLPQLREPNSFGPWLLQITRRRALGSLRGQVRRLSRDDAWHSLEPLAAADAETLAREHETQQELLAALESLPDDARELLVLFYREGQSTRQLASLLELSEAAVRKRLQRAREALREKAEAFGAQALASAPPLSFVSQVQRRLALQQAPAPARVRVQGLAAAAAIALALGGLLLWQHLAFEAESEEIHQRATGGLTVGDPPPAAERASPAPPLAPGAAPPRFAATPAASDAASGAQTPAAPAQLAAEPTRTRPQEYIPGTPDAVVGVDRARLSQLCHHCKQLLEEVRRDLLAKERQRATRTAGPEMTTELALRSDPRVAVAMHAVMRLHGALLVVDQRQALDPVRDVTAEVARLADLTDLSTPQITPVTPPLRIATIDMPKVLEHLGGAVRAPAQEGEARVRQLASASAGLLLVGAQSMARVPAAADATAAVENALDTGQAIAQLPRVTASRIGVVNFARALRECADCPLMKRDLPGRAPVDAAELERRMKEVFESLAARLEYDVVFKRGELQSLLVLDNSDAVTDLTAELLRSYDQTYAPSPLQLPDLEAKVSLANVTSARMAQALAAFARRDVDLGNCLQENERIFISTPAETLRAIFDEVGRRYHLAWSDDGVALHARCSKASRIAELAMEETRPELDLLVTAAAETHGEDCLGLRLREIAPYSPWSRRGFQQGDLLTKVNGRAVCTDPSALEALPRSRPGELTVQRNGRALSL